MCELFARYPNAKFVLMHIAYPYNDELVALAKHYQKHLGGYVLGVEHRPVQFT